MKKSIISFLYSAFIVILLANSSCKENDSDKVNDEKSYYEFTVQNGDLAGKTFKVLEIITQTRTSSSWNEQNIVQSSEIEFFEARNVTTYFLIRWNGDTPYPIGSVNNNNELGFIRLTCVHEDENYVFTSESATFTVSKKSTIQLEDKIMKTTYPAYELEGDFQGTFMAEPGNETVSISGKLKLVNVII